MAVKIIKKGPGKEATCRECGSLLSYLPADVKKYSGTDYGGDPDGREWIVCPNCGEDVILKSW